MTRLTLETLNESDLDRLVSVAIQRAEVLEDSNSSAAQEAWLEVLAYERRLAALTKASEIAGGVARAGAVYAALAAGRRHEAEQFAEEYFNDPLLPQERRSAIMKAFEDEDDLLATHFPSLAKSGKLGEVRAWRRELLKAPSVFPRAA